jgi:hypothetical protein
MELVSCLSEVSVLAHIVDRATVALVSGHKISVKVNTMTSSDPSIKRRKKKVKLSL